MIVYNSLVPLMEFALTDSGAKMPALNLGIAAAATIAALSIHNDRDG
jgi:hypothetical protein